MNIKATLLPFFIILATTSHAYYQAEQGRWLNRDPIEENGGVNLFAFTGNNGVDAVDYLGNARCSSPKVWTRKPDGTIPPVDGCSNPFGDDPNAPTGTFTFEESCNAHDLCYSDCSSSQGDCDSQFLNDMLSQCDSVYGSMYPSRTVNEYWMKCKRWARVYATAVAVAGYTPYERRQVLACHCDCPE